VGLGNRIKERGNGRNLQLTCCCSLLKGLASLCENCHDHGKKLTLCGGTQVLNFVANVNVFLR
jgi:hypothetical protein